MFWQPFYLTVWVHWVTNKLLLPFFVYLVRKMKKYFDINYKKIYFILISLQILNIFLEVSCSLCIDIFWVFIFWYTGRVDWWSKTNNSHGSVICIITIVNYTISYKIFGPQGTNKFEFSLHFKMFAGRFTHWITFLYYTATTHVRILMAHLSRVLTYHWIKLKTTTIQIF